MNADIEMWLDRRALDKRGELLGIVVDVYDDAMSRRPAWLAISTGFFGTRIAVAPLRGASLLGPDVVISHDRSTISNAPHVDIVVAVDPTQQQHLVDHYTRARAGHGTLVHSSSPEPSQDPKHQRNIPMSDTEFTSVSELIERDVIDPDGDKIGSAFDVYLDDSTGQPEWLAVTTGFFGTKVSFVPLAGASLVGEDVVVAHSKEMVKDAPRADADGQLTAEEEDALYAHYGRTSDFADGSEYAADEVEDRTVRLSSGHDTSGPNTDDAMTRSEEQVDVSTRTHEAGKARLRKWIETENVQFNVPIRREKARLVVEPITDANRDQAYAGGDLTTEEHEVILSEEVVDVTKTVVPKERVRLETEVETDEVVVDEAVRKERIAMETDVADVAEVADVTDEAVDRSAESNR